MKIVTMRNTARVAVSLKSDERGGYAFTLLGEEGLNFLPLVLMIWGATEASTVSSILCAGKSSILGDTPLPAQLFGAARSLEEVNEMLAIEEKRTEQERSLPRPPRTAAEVSDGRFRSPVLRPTRPFFAGHAWLDFKMMEVGELFEVKTRGPIQAIALLGKKYSVVEQ
jgi:hypothetical protein